MTLRIKGESATYDYINTEGELLFQVVRYEPKDFRSRRPDGNGGWIENLDGIGEKPIYNLPAILNADLSEPVLWVEEEKDADNLRAAGFVSTTSVFGAVVDSGLDMSPLSGRCVVIIPDNDAFGRFYGYEMGTLLVAAGVAEVKLIELPGLGPKGDVSDWFEVGHTPEELRELIDNARLFPKGVPGD